MLTWFLIITLVLAVIALFVWAVWLSLSPHRQAEFLFGPTLTAQQLNKQLSGKSEPDPATAIKPLFEPLWLDPEPKQDRRNRRIQQAWRHRRGILASISILSLLAVAAWYLPAVQPSLPLATKLLGIALLVYGLLVSLRDTMQLEAENSHLRIGFDQEGLLLVTAAGSIERQPLEKLAFDGCWLRAGSRYLRLTRRASKRERLQYGCSHMPRYDRQLFLCHVLPRLSGDTLVSPHNLNKERGRKLWRFWPRTCFFLGFATIMLSNFFLS